MVSVRWTAGNENGILPVVGWPTDWLLGHSHLAPLSMRPHVAGQRLPFPSNQFEAFLINPLPPTPLSIKQAPQSQAPKVQHALSIFRCFVLAHRLKL